MGTEEESLFREMGARDQSGLLDEDDVSRMKTSR